MVEWNLACDKHFVREFRTGHPRMTETWEGLVHYEMVERRWHKAEDLGADRVD